MKIRNLVVFIAVLLVAIPSAIFISRVTYKPKVYDCFKFFNEFDVLEIRLNELNDKVDKFILVEATRGQRNQDKPLYFNENKEHYAKFLHKIVHVVVDQFPEFEQIGTSDWWGVENFQRNQIMKGLELCKPNDRDIVIISDLDEIVRNEKVDQLVKLIDKKKNDVVFGSFDQYGYFLNRKIPEKLYLSIATSWGCLSKYIGSAQGFRNLSGFVKGHCANGFETLEYAKKYHPKKRWAFARIENLGWHFTSIGDFAKHREKIKSYAHIEFDCEANRNIENIKSRINSCELCEINAAFPQFVIQNQGLMESKGLLDQKETLFR